MINIMDMKSKITTMETKETMSYANIAMDTQDLIKFARMEEKPFEPPISWSYGKKVD